MCECRLSLLCWNGDVFVESSRELPKPHPGYHNAAFQLKQTVVIQELEVAEVSRSQSCVQHSVSRLVCWSSVPDWKGSHWAAGELRTAHHSLWSLCCIHIHIHTHTHAGTHACTHTHTATLLFFPDSAAGMCLLPRKRSRLMGHSVPCFQHSPTPTRGVNWAQL